ncbi:transcription termination factor MTERF2, chloroplastic [Ziziphus jujuba]|uniref:Transcription termination factor MTERF2, chloroplastic n=1 Tax=Ziziphus jujuba TaxID=326968 RepID=A0A6P4ADY7_ZIZJJ|nr:transcription termination factor MTERF2, chloroplastic [Ziziphus jujuba]XP_060676181.1 transcription termination factor MTERF2, chloroplastic [Ziziphus jujuba]
MEDFTLAFQLLKHSLSQSKLQLFPQAWLQCDNSIQIVGLTESLKKMLSCPPYQCLPFASPNLLRRNPSASTACLHDPTPQPPQLNPRSHNSKSTALLHHLTHSHSHSNHPNPKQEDLQYPNLSAEDKAKILELSLVRKRTPQFPGSIYVQSPGDADVGTSLPPLNTLFQAGGDSGDDDDDREMLMRALQIRRKVTEEIFKEAMRKGKFGITYTTNLVGRLSVFIDHVMVEAASLKRVPEFSNSSFNVRAKTVIEDSGVVRLIRWLKHNSLSYPQIGKLVCMSKGNLETIRRVTEWLKSIHVKGRFIGVVLLKAGDNLLDRSSEEFDEIVEYLERNGVRRDWMGYVMSRCPQLLTCSMEDIKTRVGFYLNMGMSENDFGTMVFDYPRVLGFYALSEMNEKVSYLKEFGLSNEDVGKLLAFKPQLMGCSIEERWKPLVRYLYYHGISRDDMRRMLTIKPMVFCVDLKTTIMPKVQFFRDIGVRDDAIGNMLVKFPPLLTYSLHKKIRPVVIFLITRAGVNEKDIGKVVALGPELLGCSIVHKLEINVKYFLSLGIHVKKLGEMIADFPMLLRYNVDILRPKYRYLRRTMVRPLQDLIEFPRFFSYSLEGRISPRHKILVENRINMKLRYMLASTDEEFENRIKTIIERRQRFESNFVNNALPNPQTIDGHDPMENETVIDNIDSESE